MSIKVEKTTTITLNSGYERRVKLGGHVIVCLFHKVSDTLYLK